jgi:phage terminase large subunit
MRLIDYNADLFEPRSTIITPWRPRALSHDQWPPDYRAVYAWRIQTLKMMRTNPGFMSSARKHYETHPADFIQDWMDTYNPRKGKNKWMPFIFFKRQYEFIEYLEDLRRDSENGLVEKCRDIGATWLGCGYTVWAWLFVNEVAIGWGSRKQELVDKIGDADSIFEKIRLLVRRLPDIWLPEGYKPRDHATFMKMINPENGAIVAGESGDNIGRGGRKTFFVKDEAAHYERPEKIEAALGDNTDVQIDLSSVNGLGNVFHRRREGGTVWTPGCTIDPGQVRVFIFDWRDHPEKTQEWYDQRKARAEREGMQHVFAQEVDRNYSAAVQNTIISYEWLTACIDAHMNVPYLRVPPPDVWGAGLDVADEGADRNALAIRQWIILRGCAEWGERDPGVVTRRTITALRERGLRGIDVEYDSIGVGASVKAEYNRLVDEGALTRSEMNFKPWNAGAGVVNPFLRIIPDDDQSALNKDFFGNMKAQAWWSMRTRVYKTWRAIKFGDVYPADELVSFDSDMPMLMQLLKELAQPTEGKSSGLRMIIEKKPNGTRSPNLADACIMAYFPAPEPGSSAVIGGYSG